MLKTISLFIFGLLFTSAIALAQQPIMPEKLLAQAMNLVEKGQYDQALNLAKPYAEQGDREAENLLGYLYQEAYNNPVEAIKWNKRAAAQGHDVAQFNLGLNYLNIYDYSSARKWFEKSAAQGHIAPPLTSLGLLYYYGDGVDRDYVKAADYFKRAVDRGDARGSYYLALCYLNSHGVKQNLAEAKRLLLAAQKAGIPNAAKKLAELGW
ncbi:tetratricopeptide repeat protein [Testudinibacter sp. P80/BLE/0925]|uniref:tetratricopeptide repeat protein n=1 Tax=Testudinibacter sp. TW-1 TaxID=3417757 RepID=UPI003D35FABE